MLKLCIVYKNLLVNNFVQRTKLSNEYFNRHSIKITDPLEIPPYSHRQEANVLQSRKML
jgi:hypothetical protein